jgi:hypothetical protein
MRVNPDKIQDWTNASYNTLEASSTSHVDNIMSWFVRIEQEAERKLLSLAEREAGNVKVKFIIAALLRSDLAARSAFYREMFMIGVFSQNNILALEDLNPIENGDIHYVQGAMIPIDIYQQWVDGEREGVSGGNQNNIATPPDNNNGNGNASAIGKAVANALQESLKDE